jgi:hypothetical protein
MRALLCAVVLLSGTPAGAHRLDEYLQATTIAVEKGRVQAEIRLAPGVAVFPLVFADIDRDADGVASAAEQRAYAARVLGDLSLRVDGRRLPLRLILSTFAPRELLQEGRGEIELRLEADVPGTAANRRLTFENHHHSRIGSYLVNGLMPRDADIRLAAQQRNYDQSFYQVDYTDASAPASRLEPWGWMDSALLALIAGVALLGRRVTAVHALVSGPRERLVKRYGTPEGLSNDLQKGNPK